MSTFEVYQLIFILVAFFFQVGALWLCYEHVKFAKKYSNTWATAFIVFFITMCITFLRRITLLGDLVNIWAGWPAIVANSIDHIAIPVSNSIGWVIFLYMLRKWWRGFFGKYFNNHISLLNREDAVKVREEVVAKREKDLLITAPNGVHVEDPEKVIVELGDRTVHLEHPKKVVIINPKKVIEE